MPEGFHPEKVDGRINVRVEANLVVVDGDAHHVAAGALCDGAHGAPHAAPGVQHLKGHSAGMGSVGATWALTGGAGTVGQRLCSSAVGATWPLTGGAPTVGQQ